MGTDIKTWNTSVDPVDDQDSSELMKKLPSLLRILGTTALLVAMYSFLVKGWQSGGDVFRYLLILGHTGAMTAIGLASGHWLKEGKGARLLLTLALVSVAANFAILGAFIFSQTTAASALDYPGYAAWKVGRLSTALVITAAAMVVLLPVVLLGFRVLSRSMSSKLAALYLISNAALLIPLRDPHLVMSTVIGIAVAVYGYMKQQRTVFGGGMVMLSIGLIYQLYDAIQVFHPGSWASLALLGMAAIVVASTVESHGYRIKLMLTARKTKHDEWDY